MASRRRSSNAHSVETSNLEVSNRRTLYASSWLVEPIIVDVACVRYLNLAGIGARLARLALASWQLGVNIVNVITVITLTSLEIELSVACYTETCTMIALLYGASCSSG